MDRPYGPSAPLLKPALGQRHAAAYLGRVDPRLRILAALAFSIFAAATRQFLVMSLVFAVALLAWACSGVPLRVALKRLLPLNVVMLLLALLLPLTSDGTPLVHLGRLEFSGEGLSLAAGIALKGNAILLLILALLGTLEAATLGHALSHLHVPDRLTQLLLFTVRYVEVLHRELLRLRAAMKVRAFRPRFSRHTYRSYGYLVGMLLVRSFDRAERVLAAMKCRGFHGHFHLLDHFVFSWRDVPFALAAAAVLAGLMLVEWLG